MKESELITFTNDKIGELRGFIKNGEPWFLSGNVCNCLGIKNARDAVIGIEKKYNDAGIKGVGSSYTLIETKGGKQKTTIIPEPFLYELIFQSRKKKAVLFRAWVTCEVLPCLRKHGVYRTGGILVRKSLTDYIQTSGENERMHGHAFSTYSKMINKSLGLPDKNNRDILDSETLEKVATRENLVKALLAEGREYIHIKGVIETLAGGSR